MVVKPVVVAVEAVVKVVEPVVGPECRGGGGVEVVVKPVVVAVEAVVKSVEVVVKPVVMV